LRPTEATIADTLGWILVQKDEAEEGVRILQEVVLQNGDQAEFKFHLAMGFAKLGRTEEARRVLEDILNNDDEFEGRKEAEALLDEL
jgi:Flp pilus assembly protein TadD